MTLNEALHHRPRRAEKEMVRYVVARVALAALFDL